INKFDLNPDMAEQIEEATRKRNIKVVGKIRYDEAFTKAQIMKTSVVEYTGGAVTEDVKSLWRNITYALG
ncbi:MAG: (4Fe-4S)-binding protein, partial [Planctomycetes bacterium]|nr:(4Fe-4S)-binding protein [Planctomycetota bacterium]